MWLWCLLVNFLIVAAKETRECPLANDRLASVSSAKGSSSSPTLTFVNGVDEELDLFWLDGSGNEVTQGSVLPLSDTARSTFPGHAFRVKYKSQTVLEHVVGEKRRQTAEISPCGELRAAKPREPSDRDEEFESLVHRGDNECPTSQPSRLWSCVRYLDESDLAGRNPEEYGIQPNETSPHRAYLTVDQTYVDQISRIPRVTSGPGYLKMNFTSELRNILVDWYSENRRRLERHEIIPGGYTNNDVVALDKLSLEKYPHVHSALIREMRDILEWWTKTRLKHTATFGVRVYRRGSTLINHVDRMDTHLASAVIQISQNNVDAGWPLELYLPNYKVAEVYAQPHQLILYEGAWLRHGRPMRFKGEEFANVFSHFAPPDWHGPSSQQSSSSPHARYYGIPPDRLTTLADRGPTESVVTSDFYAKKRKLPESASNDEL